MTVSLRALSLGVLASVVIVACSGSNAQNLQRLSSNTERSEPRATAMPHEPCVSAGGEQQAVDVNGDGRPDVVTVLRDGRLYCRETDANFDGRVDTTRFFDAQGRVLRVEDDFDFDGRVDMVGVYENGVLRSDVLDTNFDGRTDTWREYRDGRLFELRRDANADGRVDLWETYDEQGRVVRTEVDADGDGQPDPPPAAPSASASAAGASPAATTEVSASADAGTSAATGPASAAVDAGAAEGGAQ